MDAHKRQLIRRLYEKKSDNYKDTRRFTTVAAISKRITEVRRMMSAIGAEKRVHTNGRYKKLWLEQRLLGWKLVIYKDNGPDTPLKVMVVKRLLQATDCMSGCPVSREDAVREKSDQIVALLEFDLHDRDAAQLQRLIEM